MATFQSAFTLRQILLIDATASFGMGALLALLPGLIGGVTGIPVPLLFWVGVILVPIAAFMAVVALWLTASDVAVRLVILGNLLWVCASVALLFGLISPNGLGVAFILGQAGFVAAMARLEMTAARADSARRQETA